MYPMQQSNTYKFANSPLLAFQKDLTGPSIAFENVSLRKKTWMQPPPNNTIGNGPVSSKATWKWTMPSSLNKARLICSWEKKEEKDDQLFYFWRIRPHLARWPNLTVTGPKSAPLWCLVVAISPLLRLAGGGKIAVIVQPQKEDSSDSKYTPTVRVNIAKLSQIILRSSETNSSTS